VLRGGEHERSEAAVTDAAKMRRADKQITDRDELHRILDEALVLHLGMIDGQRPYVVPLNFAREGDELWLHSFSEGRKLDCLRRRPSVCVEVERLIQITSGPAACGNWTSHYESVIGFGTATVLSDDEHKLHAMQAIMGKYSGKQDWEFSPETLAKIVVVRVSLDSLTGKRSPARA
jgi:nitroimidazol reductase NimA-like FMN-containing flavoprotein (pyridoxamine 5'-phosphate oxidase superfamily)